MVIAVLTIKLHVNWVHSLKEKRMVVKSLCGKIRNKFNVSIAEVGEQDIHQIVVLGAACITSDRSQADRIIDHVIQFVEANTEGNVIDIIREIF